MTDENNPNRTVFRPSPLQKLREEQGAAPPPPAAAPVGAPPPLADSTPRVAAPRLPDDDIPRPSTPADRRNVMLAEAGLFLALIASLRAGRAQAPLPQLHGRVAGLIAGFDQATAAANYSEEDRRRARYALCATVDDIAQNLPGQAQDGAEWARRSMVVQFFNENIGGDRFWQLLDDMLTKPAQYADLIELYHACLAAGFEGRFRVQPDGKRRLHDIMTRAYAALEHARAMSAVEISPRWKGHPTAVGRLGFWTPLALAAAGAAALLLLAYILFRVILMQAGQPSLQALRAVNPSQPLRLSRAAPAPPAAPSGAQVQRLQTFLAPEIAQRLVTVVNGAADVRVRTTVGQLFKSGSDQLEPGRAALFERIGAAVETEKGPVRIEGHADSDKVATVTFPDNFALSKARATVVAGIVKGKLSNGARVTAEGYGDSQPIASNATADGKSLNRRVEIVVQRSE